MILDTDVEEALCTGGKFNTVRLICVGL